MNGRRIKKRVLISALLATLLIRVLAFGSVGNEPVRAEHPNQTIPTPTPSVMPSPLVTTEPTVAPRTREPAPPVPTELPGEPSSTPVPSPSVSMSPILTGRPTDDSTTATMTAPAGSTVTTPPDSTETPLPTEPATPTSTSMPPLPTSSPTVTPIASLASPVTAEIQTLLEEEPPLPVVSTQTQTSVSALATSTPGGTKATLLSSSCLWLGLGLLLIVTGIVVLVRWRRFG